QSPVYLAHEYMNRCWQPLYHADVVRDFRGAKLDFAGSTAYCQTYWPRTLPEDQVAMLRELPDPVLRETVKDYLFDTSFRCDVFVRGARALQPRERRALLEQHGLALVVPAEDLRVHDAGRAMADDPLQAALLETLACAPRSLGELCGLPDV